VVAGLFVGSVVGFCVFRYGLSAAGAAVVEKGSEHEGRRLDMERIALEPGLMGIILVVILMRNR